MGTRKMESEETDTGQMVTRQMSIGQMDTGQMRQDNGAVDNLAK